MAYSQTDLDTITQAIIDLGAGRRKVRATIAGNSMEYAAVDLPQLRSLRTEIAAELSAASLAPRHCYITTGRGF